MDNPVWSHSTRVSTSQNIKSLLAASWHITCMDGDSIEIRDQTDERRKSCMLVRSLCMAFLTDGPCDWTGRVDARAEKVCIFFLCGPINSKIDLEALTKPSSYFWPQGRVTEWWVNCSCSQIPDVGGLWWLSYLSTAMSFLYVSCCLLSWLCATSHIKSLHIFFYPIHAGAFVYQAGRLDLQQTPSSMEIKKWDFE